MFPSHCRCISVLKSHLCFLFSLFCLWDNIPLVSESLESLGLQITWWHAVHNRSPFFSCAETTTFRSAIPFQDTANCRARVFMDLLQDPRHADAKGNSIFWDAVTILEEHSSCHPHSHIISWCWHLSLQYDTRNVNCGESLPCSRSKDSTWGLSLLHRLPVAKVY